MSKIQLMLSLLLFASGLSAQEIVNHELRDQEEVEEIQGNGFDVIREFWENNSQLRFEDQSETLIRSLGGKKISLIGTVAEFNRFDKASKKYVRGYVISDEVNFRKAENYAVITNKTISRTDGRRTFTQEEPIALFGHGVFMRRISVRNGDVGDPASLALLRDMEENDCLKGLDQKTLEDMLYAGKIIKEERLSEEVMMGTVRLDTSTPEYFDCIVQVQGVLEFDGQQFFLTNWKFIIN